MKYLGIFPTSENINISESEWFHHELDSIILHYTHVTKIVAVHVRLGVCVFLLAKFMEASPILQEKNSNFLTLNL